MFRRQVEGCRQAGSELTARLMERCADDLEAGGPLAALLADWTGHPLLDALTQRVLGAVQGVALAGRAPDLARFLPSLGGTPVWPDAGDAFVAVIAREGRALRPRLDEQVQTNEVRRCAALLGGFLRAARVGGLPLRLLEIGSSAGLHLFWDRYRYAFGPHRWGAPGAALEIDTDWRGGPPDLAAPIRVVERRGCDLAPLDLRDPQNLQRIESFLWADQTDRHALLRAAAAALPAEGAPVEKLRAAEFVARELAAPPPGVASVIFHSSMWWYLPRAERAAVTAAIESAGVRASPDAPLFWLRSEPPSLEFAEVRLRAWPGGDDRLLARAHHHARWVEWQDTPADAPV